MTAKQTVTAYITLQVKFFSINSTLNSNQISSKIDENKKKLRIAQNRILATEII